MSPSTRTRSPHLIPRASLLDYTLADTWDASTPDELHAASYGVWLQELMGHPQWATLESKTFFVSTQAKLPITDLVWEVTDVLPGVFTSSIFSRRIKEGRVTRRVYTHFVGNLPVQAAIWLALRFSMSPVLFASGADSWDGKVIPAMGESSTLNLLRPEEVTKALKGLYFEASLRGKASNKLWLQTYGFNPIPQFKRLFEARPTQVAP